MTNKRIKELAEQNGFIHSWQSPGEQNDKLKSIEKFAELLIQECIREIQAADVGDLKSKSYYLDKVAEHIEKHFGVTK